MEVRGKMVKKDKIPLRHFVRACLLSTIVFLCILAGFELVPFTSLDLQIVTVARQGARDQRIAKDVLELKYIPKSKVEAIGELQDMLPQWEKDQASLATSLSPEALTLFNATSPDFTVIDVAAKKIIATPSVVPDIVQVQLIVDHEWPYYLSSVQIINVLTKQLHDQKIQVAIIEGFITTSLIVINTVLFVLVERTVKRYLAAQQTTEPHNPLPRIVQQDIDEKEEKKT